MTPAELEKAYVGRKFCGRLDGRQLTVSVIDVTFGGQIVTRRRGFYGSQMWDQEDWLAFESTARDVSTSDSLFCL